MRPPSSTIARAAAIARTQAGVVTRAQLIGGRRYAIVAAFAASAVLTPPDVVSQLMLAVPLILLFEGSLLAMWVTERRRTKTPADGTVG